MDDLEFFKAFIVTIMNMNAETFTNFAIFESLNFFMVFTFHFRADYFALTSFIRQQGNKFCGKPILAKKINHCHKNDQLWQHFHHLFAKFCIRNCLKNVKKFSPSNGNHDFSSKQHAKKEVHCFLFPNFWKIWQNSIIFFSVIAELFGQRSHKGVCPRKWRGTIHNSEGKDVYFYENSERIRKIHVLWIFSLSRFVFVRLHFLTSAIFGGFCEARS